MIKKFGLLILSSIAILGVGVSFANPIAPSYYRKITDVCYKLRNVKIDNYKVIIEYGEREIREKGTDGQGKFAWSNPISYGEKRKREVYEPEAKECTKCSNSLWGGHTESKVYLLDKSIDIKDITQENIDNVAIYIGDIYDSDCTSHYDKINTYKISNNGGDYEIVQSNTKDLEKIRKFPSLWFFAVLIETLVLFFIAKIFWRKDEIEEKIGLENNEISNKKLLLRGIIPTTITLPLLWFVLPLIMGDGNLYVVVGEILVTTIEAVMIKYGLNISRKRAIIASIICNLLSFLVILLFNLSQNSGPYLIRTIIEYMILSFGFILIEGVILFLEGKYLREGISNKKLITCGLVMPIIEILLIPCIIRLFDDFLGVRSDFPMFIAVITSKLLVDILIIKRLRKITWKKSIIISVLCNLYLVAIILAFIYFSNQ